MKNHWTERSINDFLFSIASDFIGQLEKKMEEKNMSQDKVAKKLGVTKGRVSQIFNNPGDNISIKKIIEYARAFGMKVSIVAYEDDDPKNKKGPINSEIFKTCWEKLNKPRDFWAVAENGKSNKTADNAVTLPTPLIASFNRHEESMPKILETDILSNLFGEKQPQEQTWEENYSLIGGIVSREQRRDQVTQLHGNINLQMHKGASL
jgi:transcriptional regulator with XRE-family HTH domain